MTVRLAEVVSARLSDAAIRLTMYTILVAVSFMLARGERTSQPTSGQPQTPPVQDPCYDTSLNSPSPHHTIMWLDAFTRYSNSPSRSADLMWNLWVGMVIKLFYCWKLSTRALCRARNLYLCDFFQIRRSTLSGPRNK
jgi:hypothetical protein